MMGQQHRFTDDEWARILEHLGYGNPHGSLWFLGMEEALPGDPRTDPMVPERVLQGWLDPRSLPFGSFASFGLAPVYNPNTPTWKIMAKLARLVLHAAEDWRAPYPTYCYIGTALGQTSGETLLIELLPLPSSSRSEKDWPPLYNERFPGGRREYEECMLPVRIERLRALVNDYQPRVVICYGRSNWPHYRNIFALHDAPETVVASRIKVLFGYFGRTVVALTPFFDYRYFPHDAMWAVGTQIREMLRAQSS